MNEVGLNDTKQHAKTDHVVVFASYVFFLLDKKNIKMIT